MLVTFYLFIYLYTFSCIYLFPYLQSHACFNLSEATWITLHIPYLFPFIIMSSPKFKIKKRCHLNASKVKWTLKWTDHSINCHPITRVDAQSGHTNLSLSEVSSEKKWGILNYMRSSEPEKECEANILVSEGWTSFFGVPCGGYQKEGFDWYILL